MVSDLIVWHPRLGAVSKQRHGPEVHAFFVNVNVGTLVRCSLDTTPFSHKTPRPSTEHTLPETMARNTHNTVGEASGKAAAEATTLETPSSFKRSAPTDDNIADFDPKQCPWNALRDVIYAKHNTNMNPQDICSALKVLYPDETQFHNLSSMDIEKMVQWWNDPSYPYRHRPLFCGWKSYENIGLRLKDALSPPKPARPLAAATVTPMRTASPRKRIEDIPLPPRCPLRDSVFTIEGSTGPDMTETRRSYDPEAVKQCTVSKAPRLNTKHDFEDRITRQRSLTHSTNTKSFRILSSPTPAKPLSQNAKASTHCAERSSNPANIEGHPTSSHVKKDSTSELGSRPYHLSVDGSSNAPTLQSGAQLHLKSVKKSLVLPPPPQLIGLYSVEYPHLHAGSNLNTRPEPGRSSSPANWNYSTPPHFPSGFSSNSRPAKRQALGEKLTDPWQRNGAVYEQLPSISSLFPPEDRKGRKNPGLRMSTAGPVRTAGQEKNQITTKEDGTDALYPYGWQDRPVLLPALELRTPSIPSLSSTSAVTLTSSCTEESTMTYPSTPLPSLTPLTHSAFVIRKRYSEGILKYLPASPSTSTIRKQYSEGSLKFSASACPWHAIRDVALAQDRMNLTKEQIALLLSHRYGTAYPFLKQVTRGQVQELWQCSRMSGEALYTEWDCGVVEQQIRNDLRILGLMGWGR